MSFQAWSTKLRRNHQRRYAQKSVGAAPFLARDQHHTLGLVDGVKQQVDVIRGHPARLPTFDDGLRSLEIVVAAERAAGVG